MDVRDRSTYISNLETTVVQPPRLPDAGTSGSSGTASPVMGDDSSRLSPMARSLAQAMQMPDVREDRIASLQQRIASGSYQIPSQELADAILRSVAD